LLSVATHKASRLITKDRVSSTVRAPFTRFEDDARPDEVSEAARGRGLRRAIGARGRSSAARRPLHAADRHARGDC
jgi:hypothetical protein